MDEMNVHQFWGISPCIDMRAASIAACASTTWTATAEQQTAPLSFLQVCPYDCRHTIATLSSFITNKSSTSCAGQPTKAAAAAHPQQDLQDSTEAYTQQQVKQQQQQQQQQAKHEQQQLHLYVYEAEPEVLARHMLLLSLLFDGRLTVRQRAEMFLELHGNVMLRQHTADYLVEASRHLEGAISQLSLCASSAAAAAAAANPAKPNSDSHSQACQQQQQQQQGLGVLAAFNLSLLRYQERDALLETFQQYRSKAKFNMAKAWDDRCRKWYGDRYDFRTNMVDWDYHMRLSPRGTPFMDPAHGSIVHFYHFRHWRLTGVAHELRDSSYRATNSSLLSTAYGRSKEYKDRQLRDVGRSVAAFSYWGDVLNGPYHAFGTVADDPALFKINNKQFTHTAMDVAEHNLLSFIHQLRSGLADRPHPTAGATATPCSSSSSSSSGSTATDVQSHRANAARGPTSMESLTAAETMQRASDAADNNVGQQHKAIQLQQQRQQQQQRQCVKEVDQRAQQIDALQLPAKQNKVDLEQVSNTTQQQQQQQQQRQQKDSELEQLAAVEAAVTAVSVQRVVASVKIFLVSGDLKRNLTSKSKCAGIFTAATVGHRHVHMLSPDYGLANVLRRPEGLVFVESGQNMIQLNGQQVDAFEQRVVELASAAGFELHPAFSVNRNSSNSNGEGSTKQQQQGSKVSSYRLPPGHFALGVGCS